MQIWISFLNYYASLAWRIFGNLWEFCLISLLQIVFLVSEKAHRFLLFIDSYRWWFNFILLPQVWLFKTLHVRIFESITAGQKTFL